MPFVHNSVSHDHIVVPFMTFFGSFNWPRLPSWIGFFTAAWRWQWQHVRAARARSSKQNTRANISVFCLQIWPSIKSRAITVLINVYLAFIHIGRYDIKARRHLACVQNGITQLGDWRMETWQLALRARCHVSIRQSPSLCNAILNTCPCLLAIVAFFSATNLSSYIR